MKKDNVMVKGAFVLALGSFISKFLGALYRVPLTSVIGSYGIGLYQMVFPIYTLLLDFSGAGAPNAISKLIAENKDNSDVYFNQKILKVSKKLLGVLGGFFSLFMLIFSFIIAKGQGNSDCSLAYVFLSPSVFLCCMISVFRGYFQGLMEMKPTSVSQVIEQVIKLVFGLSLAYAFRSNTVFAVSLATLSITISEIVALLYLLVKYKKLQVEKTKIKIPKHQEKKLLRLVVKNVIPVSLIGIVMPLIHVADSFMIVNILGKYLDNATSVYGLSTGVVHTLVNLPVSICYSISTVAVPIVSKCSSQDEKSKKGLKTVLFTLLVAGFLALGVFIFSNQFISILFSRLTVEEHLISNKLLKLSSVNILLLSLLQTENAVMIGQNKLYYPLLSMGIGGVIKIILNFILLSNPSLNIYGGALALITCYFVCNLINLGMIFKLRVKNADKKYRDWQLSNEK